MPLITAVNQLADGIEIINTRGAPIIVTSADIPTNVKNQGLAAVQTWFVGRANTLLANNGMALQGTLLIVSHTPLILGGDWAITDA